MKFVKLISLVVALSLSFVAFAAELDLSNYARLKLAIADYPNALKPIIDKKLAELTPEREPVLWLRAFSTYISITEDLNTIPKIEEKLRFAITLADKNRLYEEAIDLKDTLLWFEIHNKNLDFAAISTRTHALFDEAESHRLIAKKAMLMSSFASYVRETGDMPQAVKLLHESNALLSQAPDATDLDRLNMKNVMALILGYQGQKDKALALYQEALALCKKLKVRSLQATLQYNIGKSLIDKDDPEKIREGGRMLLDAIKLTEEIDEAWSAGALMSGLGIYYRKIGQFEQSVTSGKKAVAIFSKIDDKEWVADSYKKLAVTYMETKRFPEAVEALKQALKISPAEYKQDHSQMLDLLAEAQAGMGQYTEAYASLRQHLTKYKELATEKEKADYSKTMVGLGLQVEEEKNRTLSAENELQNVKLQETERLRIIMFIMLGLSILVVGAMYVAVRRSFQVKESKLKMQRILDNIDEGILTINKDFQIEPDYSKHLKRLFGSHDFSHKDAVNELFGSSNLPSDMKSMIREALKVAIGEDDLNWETNSHLLPHEVYYPGPEPRYIAFHWQAICNSDQKVLTVLLGLRDVTARKAMEEQIQAAQNRSARWTVKVAELLQTDTRKVLAVIGQAEEIIKKLQQPLGRTTLRDAMRNLHTVKGVARTIALRSLAKETHELEEWLTQAHKDEASLLNLREQCRHFETEVADYRQLIEQIFQRSAVAQTQSHALNEAVNQNLQQLLAHLHKNNMAIQGIDIIDHALPWPPDLLGKVTEILVHALNNSIDHGFIIPKEKGRAVKPVHLIIEAKRNNHRLELVVTDNGVGLDIQGLTNQARQRGLVTNTNQNVWDLAFSDGLSTAEKSTETSGRGVGLSGIRQICEELGGSARLEPNTEGGTRLLIELPQALSVDASA